MSSLLTHRYAAYGLDIPVPLLFEESKGCTAAKVFTERYLEGVLTLQGLSDLR